MPEPAAPRAVGRARAQPAGSGKTGWLRKDRLFLGTEQLDPVGLALSARQFPGSYAVLAFVREIPIAPGTIAAFMQDGSLRNASRARP